MTVLFIAGGTGAQALNEMVVEFAAVNIKYQVIHITGRTVFHRKTAKITTLCSRAIPTG